MKRKKKSPLKIVSWKLDVYISPSFVGVEGEKEFQMMSLSSLRTNAEPAGLMMAQGKLLNFQCSYWSNMVLGVRSGHWNHVHLLWVPWIPIVIREEMKSVLCFQGRRLPLELGKGVNILTRRWTESKEKPYLGGWIRKQWPPEVLSTYKTSTHGSGPYSPPNAWAKHQMLYLALKTLERWPLGLCLAGLSEGNVLTGFVSTET